MNDESTRLAEPFEHLTWDGDDWTGPVVLPGWAGFRTRLGPSDGTAELVVGGGGEDDPRPPSEAQARAFLHLMENEPAVTRAVQEAILAEYPRLRAIYGRLQHVASAPELMPRVGSIRDLQPLIGLSLVHVPEDERDGIAYVGFELGCSWDVEHGLGVITHAGRVLGVGEADISVQPPDEEDEQTGRAKRWWEFWK